MVSSGDIIAYSYSIIDVADIADVLALIVVARSYVGLIVVDSSYVGLIVVASSYVGLIVVASSFVGSS